MPRLAVVVEDDECLRRLLARRLSRSGFTVREASSVEQGIAAAHEGPAAAIIDLGLPDGNGFEVVAAMLQRGVRRSHILVATGSSSARDANRAQVLGVAFARKPEIGKNVSAFLERILADENGRRDVSTAVDQLARSAGFTPQQRRIIDLMLAGVRRSELAIELGVAETTIRTHVRAIVTRLDVDNLERVGWKILEVLSKAD